MDLYGSGSNDSRSHGRRICSRGGAGLARRNADVPAIAALVPALRRDAAVRQLPEIGGADVSTYLSSDVVVRLAEAQRDVDRHVVTGRDGRCRACGEMEPCTSRLSAAALFARYGLLPVRRPGLAASRVSAR